MSAATKGKISPKAILPFDEQLGQQPDSILQMQRTIAGSVKVANPEAIEWHAD